MIYFTGDTHGELARFSPVGMAGEESWGEGDTLIVCGDFGFVFTDSEEEREKLELLSRKPYTICFCDGNHENFPLLKSYPKEYWRGGRIHRIRPNVIHLMRGQVFTIENKRIFTMGGAYSIDRYLRIEGLSWWKEELPDNGEYREASQNLKEQGMAVDYVVSHTAPGEIIRRMGYYPDRHDAELTGFLEWVMAEVQFEKWFFGHWHQDKRIADRFYALWFEVQRAEGRD